MDGTRSQSRPTSQITRRDALKLGAGTLGAAMLGAAGCAPNADEAKGGGGGGGGLVFLSTQLRPVEEAEKMRQKILADYDGKVEFLGEDAGPFNDRIEAEAQAGKGTVGVIGAEHGDMSGLAAKDRLMDLSDLTSELASRGFNEDYLELAKLGGDKPLYIPWMQASYVMVARKEAMELVPGGADPSQGLSYDQVTQWAKAIADKEGSKRFGLPLADDGLVHRFMQGFTYPSYTGGLNTTFKSSGAASMWDWFKSTWAYANPQSTGYAFMQEPLQGGEVWLAWDHVARMIDALRANPDGFVAFPCPTGPKGLGYLAVLNGLAIPKTAPNPDESKKLITYLTDPKTAAVTVREVGFFPPTKTQELPADVDAGIKAEAAALAAQAGNAKALTSLLPVGLGEKSGAYNDVFRGAMEAIVLKNQPVQQVLDSQSKKLQGVLDEAKAKCWKPDPPSSGTCKVG
jgi:multiple sugar transport system substrate-binding protein